MVFQKDLIESLRRHGKRIAIDDGLRRVTYSELLADADNVTRVLLDYNVPCGTAVGVFLDDRYQIICTIIGVVNARCVFVPLDKALPSLRLSSMLTDLNLKHVIKSTKSPKESLFANQVCFGIDEIFETSNVDEGEPINYPKFDAEDSLYIYFTSGSTGVPKGVIGKNCSLLQFLKWEIETFDLTAECRVSQLISPYFDAFLRDVFAPLLAGGTVCIPPPEHELFTSDKITSWIDRCEITLIHCVPSVFRLINNESITSQNFVSLRHILLSGERVVPGSLRNWFEVFGNRIQLVNLYGATETTMIRSFYLINRNDVSLSRMPIGGPIADTKLLISNNGQDACNALVPGDLYIISKYTSNGYLNSPELTNERFIRLNAGTPYETVAFRTGDKARMLANGTIDLLGREDRQIKLRGIRIELDEIENVLFRHPFVENAVAVRHSEKNGDDSLAVFFVGKNGIDANSTFIEEVKKLLEDHLPSYMIPSKIVEIRELPLLSSGKVDYSALANSIVAHDVVVAPVTNMEIRVLSVWKEILGDKDISTEESFHKAGGNSLALMKLISRLHKSFGVRFSLSDLFNNLTIKKQAAFIATSGDDNIMVVKKAEAKPAFPLSSAQQRMYYNYDLDRSGVAFNMPMVWEIKNDVDLNKVRTVIEILIGRHESLRTSFHSEDGKLYQAVAESVQFSIQEIDSPGDSLEEAILGFVRPFDLVKAPLMRVGFIKALGNKPKKLLVVDLHHIICDGMSQLILQTEFAKLYEGLTLDALPIQYKDYAEWEHQFKESDLYTSHREFWLSRFECNVPRLQLPIVATGMEQTEFGGNVDFKIDRQTVKLLMSAFEKDDITTFSALFSIYFVFLSQLSGQEDIVVGITSAGRTQAEVENVVGMFVKTLPIRYLVELEKPFREFTVGLHGHLQEAFSKQAYDLADLMSQINSQNTDSIESLFDAMFVFQNFEIQQGNASSARFIVHDFRNHSVKLPLTLFVTESETAFCFRLEYSYNWLARNDADLLALRLKALIEVIAKNATLRIDVCMDVHNPKSSGPLVEHDITFTF